MLWEARVRCVFIWYKVLGSKVYEGRLLRRAVGEAVRFGKGHWIQKMIKCVGEFWWQGVNVDDVQNLSEVDLKEMLVCATWQRVREEWKRQMEIKPKLAMMKLIGECEVELNCACLKSKQDRRRMV